MSASPKETFALSAIEVVLVDLLRAPLVCACTGEVFEADRVRARLLEAKRAIRDEPWLVPTLPRGEAAALAELRLAIAHTSLDPLEVGPRAAALAAALVTRLAELEHRAHVAPDTALALRTIAALHPSPGDGASEDLGALLRDWEARAAIPQTRAAFWAQKRVQNVRFFRAFFLALPYAARARRIAATLPVSMRRSPAILDTYGALEQLGPVLDNFVFDLGVRATFADHTAIADFAFLYMQLADELVDNLVKLGGLAAVRALVERIYAPGQRAHVFIPFEDLDDDHLRAVGIDPGASIPKYDTTVRGLVVYLADLRVVLDARLVERREADALRASTRDFFHHCFATFLDEVELPTRASGTPLDRLPLADVAWHFYRKNNLVMARWLALRARLLGLDPLAFADVIGTWGYVLATFQIFDDMKDLAIDLGCQPSYALELAWTRHRDEHAFLVEAYGPQPLAIDRNDVPRLMLAMPRTMRDCMRLSRVMTHAFLEWFTRYVFDYRWRRNWLVRGRSFHRAPEGGRDVPIEALVDPRIARVIDVGVPVIDALFRVIAQTASLADEHGLDDEYLAFVIDAVGYDHGAAITRAALPDLRLAYRFVNLRMVMRADEKARLFVKLCARHREAATRALVALRWTTGSSTLAFALGRRVGIDVQGRAVAPLPAAT